jgi:hypothetical protein
MMLFAVVCLILLASLSLLAANSRLREAERFAEHSTAYYAADYEAVRMFNSAPEPLADGDVYEYSVKVDDYRVIEVALISDGEAYHIARWQLVSTREWSPEGGMTLFDAEDEVTLYDD